MELRSYLLMVLFNVHRRFLTDVYAAGTGTVTYPFQQYVKQGQEAVLQCKYESSRLVWRKNVNGTLVVMAIQNIIIESTKYNVSVNPNTGLYYRLHVLNSKPDDELIYNCRGKINEGYYIQLILYIPPLRIYFHGSMTNKLEGIEGTDLLIRCIADGGKPPPYVSILDGTRPNSTQEVSYTISKISRGFHQKSIVCQATSYALVNPMTTTVQIYLNLKPLTPIFNTNEVSTEETVPLTVSCTSYGSRPAATFTWTIGGNDVTSSSTISQPVIESNDTNTVTSTFMHSVDRNHAKQSIKCIASNTVGSVSASKMLDVKYAPGITVNSPTYIQNDAIRIVTCYPSGNPDSYTYHKWQHKSKYGELVREFDGNKTLKLQDAPEVLRYQDSGEYVCTASNGIKDNYNKLEQTGSGYLTINAQPVFTSDIANRVVHFGEINKTVDIYVNVYSVPKFTSFVWVREGKPITIQNSAKYESSSSPTIVKDVIHGKELQLDGYNVRLTIHDLKAEDFANYTVTLRNEYGNIIYTISLEHGVPETPGNFSTIDSAATSLTVQWDPNSSGGYKQTFYTQYRVQGLLVWTTVSVGEEEMNEPKTRRTYELRNLQEGKTYELRMFAENAINKRSYFTDVLIAYTAKQESTSNVVIGAVVGIVITLLIVCAFVIAIIFFKRSQGKNQTGKEDKYYENTGFQEIQKGGEYEEVENKFDMEDKQSSKTYESLHTKDTLNVYDDLKTHKGATEKVYENEVF